MIFKLNDKALESATVCLTELAMYVYMYTCTCKYTYILHAYTYNNKIYTQIHNHMHKYIRIHMYAHTPTYFFVGKNKIYILKFKRDGSYTFFVYLILKPND